MERQLKQRVVGAALLVAFGVIFIPIFLDNDALDAVAPPAVDIPPPPDEPPAGAEPLDAAAIDTLGQSLDAPLAAPAATGAAEPAAGAAAPVPELVEEVIAATASEASPSPPPPERPLPAPAPAPVVKPPPSAPTPASAAPASDPTVSGWAIQLGSFASEDNARRLLERLRGAGYTAYLEKHREGSSTVFKVRVGPERQRTAAEQLRDRLEREFATKGMLRPYR